MGSDSESEGYGAPKADVALPNTESELGEFSPPDNYTFEPELEEPIPRPIPPSLKTGYWARARRRKLVITVCIGGLLFFSANTQLIENLSYFWVTLAYLNWIAFACLAGAAAYWIYGRVSPGPYRYVRYGKPVVIRVLETQPIIKKEKRGLKSLHYQVRGECLLPEKTSS